VNLQMDLVRWTRNWYKLLDNLYKGPWTFVLGSS